MNSDRLQVSIIVTGLDFDDEMKFRNRKEIRDLLDSFVDQTNAYRLIWDRPIKRQPIHKDLVRLCSRLKIVHEKEGIVNFIYFLKIRGKTKNKLINLLASST